MTWVSLVLKTLGLADLAARALEKWKAWSDGRASQRAADITATSAVQDREAGAVADNTQSAANKLRDGTF